MIKNQQVATLLIPERQIIAALNVELFLKLLQKLPLYITVVNQCSCQIKS